MNLKIADIKIGNRFRTDLGNLDELKASILKSTLLHPIVVSKDHRLICGRRRLEACKQLGWKEIRCHVVDIDPLIAERDENACRKDFTLTERVAIARAIEEREKPKAAERKQSTQAKPGNDGRKPTGSEKFTEPAPKAEAADVAAKAVDLSRPTYQKAKEIVDAANADPEKFGDLPKRMDDTGKVDPVYREMEKRKEPEAPKPAPFRQPDIMDDWVKIKQLIERLRSNWSPADCKTIAGLLKQLAGNIT